MNREVAARAEHGTAESVRTTCSFARAERLLGGEYHGRFLIELLQNAADAWRNHTMGGRARSRVAVVITEEPALIVANQGVALTPEVVIESLGHIGASTKSEGEAIGHKGIGFKSVLEMTSRPEIYSGLQEPKPTLAVRFDPSKALARIEEVSPRWAEFVAGVPGLDPADRLAAVPTLRYPMWEDNLPKEIQRLAEDGFDTAVRLPFDPEFAARRGSTQAAWVDDVRRAVTEDLSDQILLLLGAFSEVVVENRLDGEPPTRIRPVPVVVEATEVPGATGESVLIERSGTTDTLWWIYRRSIGGEGELAGEIVVGLRFEPSQGAAARRLAPAVDGAASAPFHLFFPTRIHSGLPFLLHGYFRVDASRKGFHGAAQQSNERILSELARLVRDVVEQTSREDGIDASSLVNLVAACPEPEDSLALAFRGDALSALDDTEWIPAASEGSTRELARPHAFFASTPRLTHLVADVFSPSYVRQRTELALLHPELVDAAIELVRSRQHEARDSWTTLHDLCRPGDIDVWADAEADQRFRHLISLVDWLRGEDADRTDRFLKALRGDPESRLVPVVAQGGRRQLLPLPDPSEGMAGKRSQLVMARIRSAGARALVPPPELEVSFLPDGLFGSEQEVFEARSLGIRPFTVDNVLDRLNGVGESGEDPDRVLSFLWELLVRERRNQYGTKKVAERAAVFNPAEWFWCRPGRAQVSETRRLEQQRERYLAGVLLPARNGSWRPAGELAFGADWATWIESHPEGMAASTVSARATAYRALEAVCPDTEGSLLEGPEKLLARLRTIDLRALAAPHPMDNPAADVEDVDGTEEELTAAGWNRERHAFLLRLGVWEVLPIEAFEGRDRRGGRAAFPWKATGAADRQIEIINAQGGWRFGLDGWRGHRHWTVYLAEDYRFQWPLDPAARRGARSVTTLLSAGIRLYESRLIATFFCPGCSDSGSPHRAPRQSTSVDGYPSCLAVQMRTEAWVPVSVAGSPLEAPAEPSKAWWLDRAPTGPGLMTSPWRFVPICSPDTGVSDELRRLGRVTTMDDAGAAELTSLLSEMRHRFASRDIDLARSIDRRSFVSLHSMVYERLAELPDRAGGSVLAQTGVLCHRGNGLVIESVADALHDDGRYSPYVRHFVDRVPLAVIPRDQGRIAKALDIRTLTIMLRRDGGDRGVDVTDELTDLLAGRLPELLAILVHHSQGTQTLGLDSKAFQDRAQRFKRLTVRQVGDLVIHASIEGVDEPERLGGGRTGDLFLEAATPNTPAVLYHDFDGDGWQDRLRRKIAPHLAAVLDATPYAHTFALFLQAEGGGEREEFLLDLGISDQDVEAVKAHLGVVGTAERSTHTRWYTAVLQVLGSPDPPTQLDPETLETALQQAGMSPSAARLLVQAGGGDNVRRDTGPGSALRTLDDEQLDLRELDAALRSQDKDDGLRLLDASRAFTSWKRAHERRVAAARSRTVSGEEAKADVRRLAPPPEAALTIDPPLASLLVGVAELLAPADQDLAQRLADNPVGALTRLGGFSSADDLDSAALLLYDAEEQRRAFRDRASRWRDVIRRLAVLVRMSASETRLGVQAHDRTVGGLLDTSPEMPSDLVGPVEELFAKHQNLRHRILDQLDDGFFGPEPDNAEIDLWTRDAGIDEATIATYRRALSEPRNRRATALRARVAKLADAHCTATLPAGLVAPAWLTPRTPDFMTSESSTPAPIKVSSIKVSPTVDQRKRELGDEGEQWALADVIGVFLAMGDDERANAVADVRRLLGYFEPEACSRMLRYADAAAAPRGDQDDYELVSALEGLLHISRHSDGFGFDVIGWASPRQDAEPHAMCLEVKSTTGGGFHFSTGEWRVARELAAKSAANRYAVLTVRRGKAGEVPEAMDLLVDPVGLVDAKLLVLDPDGYAARYAPRRGGTLP